MIRLLRRTKRWLIYYKHGSSPDILLFGIRRGGSTYLADMLATERGMMFVNEPFAVFVGHSDYEVKRKWLPKLPHSQFFALSSAQYRQVRNYTNHLLSGDLRLGTCRRTNPILCANRMLLKILNAPFLIDWFSTCFQARVLFMTRHPAAQAISVLRNRWGFSAEAYFHNPDFLSEFMSSEQIEYGNNIFAVGSDWQKAILNWVVENKFPLYHSKSDVLKVTYEELTLSTNAVVGGICEKLQLSNRCEIVKTGNRPSGSSRMSTIKANTLIRSNNKEALIKRWQNQINKNQRAQAQSILDEYAIDIYQMDTATPNPSYLIEPNTPLK